MITLYGKLSKPSRLHVPSKQLLKSFLTCCYLIAHPFAFIHFYLIRIRFTGMPAFLSGSECETRSGLQKLWYTRITRRLVSAFLRTPYRKNLIELIDSDLDFPPGKGCVIAICHSPWKRILVEWCIQNKFALIVGGGSWKGRKKSIQRQGQGLSDLRSIINCLQNNGRVILAGDVFNNNKNCPVMFMGNNSNACFTHARLALIAGVPLVAVVPSLTREAIRLIKGPELQAGDIRNNMIKATQDILLFFENEIRREPSVWSPYVY